MNTRFKILMVVGIALILPAVAFADVAISGSINVIGSQASPSWGITGGPNSPQAAGYATISHPTGRIADMDLENAINMSVFTINVYTIYFKTTGTFYLNATHTHGYPAQARMYFSTSLMTLNDFSGESATSLATSAPTPSSDSGILSLNLSNDVFTSDTGSTVPTPTFTISSTSTVIYIGFYLPAGAVAGAEVTFNGNFVLS
jgi:hypothetical protein